MKRTIYFLIFSLLALPLLAAEDIEVSDSKCIVMDFDSEIRYVDFGSQLLRGHKLSHSSMLALNCMREFGDVTSLSVVTADGKYHEFRVRYSSNPSALVWSVSGEGIPIRHIELSTIRTFHMIAHEQVTDFVPGSDSIIVDYAEQIGNIIKAKAAFGNFVESSLVLVTKSGGIYPFRVSYSDNLDGASLELDTTEASGAIFNDAPVNDVEMEQLGKKVSEFTPILNDVGVASQHMLLSLGGVYCQNDILMFQMRMANCNQIDYDIDFVKVYIQDRKRSRTIAVQEDELVPIHIYDSTGSSLLKGGEVKTMVLFFRRFTLPPKRVLCFEVFERNGGRHMRFTMSDKEILKARIFK